MRRGIAARGSDGKRRDRHAPGNRDGGAAADVEHTGASRECGAVVAAELRRRAADEAEVAGGLYAGGGGGGGAGGARRAGQWAKRGFDRCLSPGPGRSDDPVRGGGGDAAPVETRDAHVAQFSGVGGF